MTKWTRIFCAGALVVSALCAGVFAQPPTGSPVARHGQLKVEGNRILDEHNNPVILRGMSLFWECWAPDFYNASVVRTLAATDATGWRASVVRAAQGTYNGSREGVNCCKSNDMTRTKAVIDAAIEVGIYVIVDWHSHAAELEESDATAFFQSIAQTYGNKPNIIYEIYNEPISQSWSTIKSYANTMVSKIRAIDSKNIILIGTRDYSKWVDEAAASPVSGNHLAYVLHFYAAQEGHKSELRNAAAGALTKGVPVFISEFGTTEANGGGKIDTAETNTWFKFSDDNGIGWCNWSINNKPESASALTGGAGTSGGWADNQLSESGRFIRSKLRYYGTPVSVSAVGESHGTGQGQVNISPNTSEYFPGQTLTLTAVPANTGSRFEGWTGGLGGDVTPNNLYLTSSLTVKAVFFQENLLKNSTFTVGRSNWTATTGPGANGSFDAANGEGKVTVTTANASNNRNLRLQQTGVTLENGKRYKLSFKARSVSATRSITPVVVNASGTNFMQDTAAVQLTTTMTPFNQTFDMTAATTTAAIVAFYCGAVMGDWIIDDVALELVGQGTAAAAPHAAPGRTAWSVARSGGALRLRGPAEAGARVSLYDVRGKMVRSVAARDGMALNVAGVPAGSYFVVVKNRAGSEVMRERVSMVR